MVPTTKVCRPAPIPWSHNAEALQPRPHIPVNAGGLPLQVFCQPCGFKTTTCHELVNTLCTYLSSNKTSVVGTSMQTKKVYAADGKLFLEE